MGACRRTRARYVIAAATARSAALFVTACVESDPPCFDGEYIACRCGDAHGYQQCVGDAYAGCVCDGTTPGLLAAGGGGAGGGGGGLLGFLSPCDDDAQCESGLCFSYVAKGPKCTVACSSDADCPPPSPGCAPKAVCKAP